MAVKLPRIIELLNIRSSRGMTEQETAELIIEDKKRLGQPYDKSLEKIAYAKVKPKPVKEPTVEEPKKKRKVKFYTDDELAGLYRQDEIDILLRYGVDKKDIPSYEKKRINMIKELQGE